MTDYIYTRVSTAKQNLTGQLETLTKAYPNAEQYSDKASGKDLHREGFEAMNHQLIAGDRVIIYDLSRLGRNTADLLTLVDDWKRRGVGLVVHNMLKGETLDTSTATGYMLFTVVAAVGQMQREIQAEKAAIGMAEAVEAGKMQGTKPRKTKLIEAALADVDAGMSKEKAARANGIGVATLYRAIKSRS